MHYPQCIEIYPLGGIIHVLNNWGSFYSDDTSEKELQLYQQHVMTLRFHVCRHVSHSRFLFVISITVTQIPFPQCKTGKAHHFRDLCY